MAFDIVDPATGHVISGTVVRIPASQSQKFPFLIKHKQGSAAMNQPVSIESDGVILGWNESKLDSTGQKSNSIGPSLMLCGDGELTVSVGPPGHVAKQTLGFRFVKQG